MTWTILVVGGAAATVAVVAGFIARAAGLHADREFARLRSHDVPDGACPPVTVVVPARDEERNIRACLESLLALDYPGVEILVVDDGSSDRTPDIVREVGARSAATRSVRLIGLDESPDADGTEWASRKSRALWRGATEAAGEWILFADADTRLKPDALRRAVAFARRRNLRALSLSGVFVNPGLWGGLLESALTPAVFLAIPWKKVNDPRSPAAWMNGNFILYERAAYFGAGGHRAVAARAADDLSLALRAKAAGVRFLFLPVTSAYECRDYVNLREAFRGWTRRLSTGGEAFGLSRGAYVAQTAVLFAVGVWPLIAAASSLWGPLAGRTVAGVDAAVLTLGQLGALIGLLGGIRAAMRMSVGPAVLAPAAAALAIAAVASGYRARFRTRVIEYRGRTVVVRRGPGEDGDAPAG